MSSAENLASLRRGVSLDGYALLIGGLILLNLWRTLTHAPWGDEWQAWLVAVESPDLPSLIRHIRHEGHPSLWYLLLRPLGTLTHDPVAMQLPQWLIGALVYLLIAFASPFSRTERVLILLSYFLFFEYLVLSRSYALGALFLLGFAWLRQHRPEASVPPWLLLGLAVNTHALAAIAAVGLGFTWLATTGEWRRHLVGVAVFTVCLAAAAFSAVPPAEDVPGLVAATSLPSSWMAPLTTAVRAMGRATTYVFLPIEDAFPDSYWNPTFGPTWLRALLSAPILLVIAWIFRHERDVLLAFGLCFTGVIMFSTAFYPWTNNTRHYGILFVVFVIGLWTLRARGRTLPRLAYVLLALNAVGGLQAAVGEQLRPFSHVNNVAAWIEANGHADAFWIAAPDLNAIGVAARLGRSFYYPECTCMMPFVRSGSRWRLQPDGVPESVTAALRAVGRREAMVLLAGGLADAMGSGSDDSYLRVELLARFDGAEVDLGRLGENFAVYRVALR